jgi:thymidine phosphorylase
VDPATVLASGEAYETWARMIRAQGGDPDANLPQPEHVHVVAAPRDGFLSRLDALGVGVAAWRLGAGRARKEDPVQAAAGVLCHVKPGEPVVSGAPLLELHTDTPDAVEGALAALAGAYAITDEAPASTALVLETIRG